LDHNDTVDFNTSRLRSQGYSGKIAGSTEASTGAVPAAELSIISTHQEGRP